MEKKLFEKLKKQLFSSEKKQIIDALEFIKKEGDDSIIELLAEALVYYDDEKIKFEIRRLFLEIKNKNVVKNILKIIEDNRFLSERKFFISLCWQLPLQFDDFYDKFLKIFYNENFDNAFEAFTVIETIINKEEVNYPKEIIEKRIDDLKFHLSELDEQKKILSMDLIHGWMKHL